MWRTSDGVIHTVAIPTDVPALSELRSEVDRLSQKERLKLDERLMDRFWAVADELDNKPWDKEAEQTFMAVPLPLDLIKSLPWRRLLGNEVNDEIQKIDLRWRADVTQVLLRVLDEVEES